MQTESNRHFAEELLERYSMGCLPEEQVPALEEHLLMCSECQMRLTSIDEYVMVAKAATAELERKKMTRKQGFREFVAARFWPIPKPVWALSFATAALAVVLSVAPIFQFPPGRQTEVTLSASRGNAPVQPPRASSHDDLLLNIDATTVPAAPAYRLQLVNVTGAEVWRSNVSVEANSRILAKVPKKLSRGKYWVRIYSSTDLQSPLQEYGLAIE